MALIVHIVMHGIQSEPFLRRKISALPSKFPMFAAWPSACYILGCKKYILGINPSIWMFFSGEKCGVRYEMEKYVAHFVGYISKTPYICTIRQ